jgi:LAS superfamily LD-carboxypeptidase LdcB
MRMSPFEVIRRISVLSAFVLITFVPMFANAASRNYTLNDIDMSVLKEWQQQGGFQTEIKPDEWSSGVILLQKVLAQNPALYDADEYNYHYDEETEDAMRRFQKAYKVKATGVFDAKTREKLNGILFTELCPRTKSAKDMQLFQITKDDSVPENYIPKNLTPISDQVRTAVVTCVAQEVVSPLTKMFQAAEKDGVKLMVSSGYRSPEMQKYVYDYWISVEGKDAKHEVAKPGYSEHQLGTAVDLTDASIQYSGVDDAFAKSAGGKWLKKNAHKYGFAMSYQKGKEKVTGFAYEPWHWRYVGKQVATTLREKKISFAEYNAKKISKTQLLSKNKKERIE